MGSYGHNVRKTAVFFTFGHLPTFAHPRIFLQMRLVSNHYSSSNGLIFLLFSPLGDGFRWPGRHRRHGQLVRQAEPRSRVRNMVGRRDARNAFCPHAVLVFLTWVCWLRARLLPPWYSSSSSMTVRGRCEIQVSRICSRRLIANGVTFCVAKICRHAHRTFAQNRSSTI